MLILSLIFNGNSSTIAAINATINPVSDIPLTAITIIVAQNKKAKNPPRLLLKIGFIGKILPKIAATGSAMLKNIITITAISLGNRKTASVNPMNK